MPYYQKIESDMIDTAAVVEYDQPPTDKMADYEQPTRKMGTVADYEQPMTKLNKNSSTKHNDIIQHNNGEELVRLKLAFYDNTNENLLYRYEGRALPRTHRRTARGSVRKDTDDQKIKTNWREHYVQGSDKNLSNIYWKVYQKLH